MAHPYHHAQSSAKHFGVDPELHLPIHQFLDHSKESIADPRHRGLFHHDVGALLASRLFAKIEHAQEIALRHIQEDLGKIPTINDWLPNPPRKLRQRFSNHRKLRSTTLQSLLDGNPFAPEEQDTLETLLQFLLIPEEIDPSLKERAQRLFYFQATGPFLCEQAFGICLGPESKTPTRYAAEWIIRQATGKIYSWQDFVEDLPIEDWMHKNARPVT